MSEDTSRRATAQKGRITRRNAMRALGVAASTALAGCIAGGGTTNREDVSGRYSRRYALAADEGTMQIQVDVPRERYVAAQEQSRSFARAVDAARDSATLEQIGHRIAQRYSSDVDRFLAVQSLVTEITYTQDIESTDQQEYIRYPSETIVEDTGDCEDLAILFAGLLSSPALGFRTGFVIPKGHCAVLVDRRDLPESLLAPDPLTVTVAEQEYVYVEGVEEHEPGAWARDYGERPLLVAYRDGWYPLDASALANHSLDVLTNQGLDTTAQFFQ